MTPTTIQLDTNTKHRLDELKPYPRATYDEVVIQLIQVSEQLSKDPELLDEIKKDIEEARREIQLGKTVSTDTLLKELNINEL